MPKPKKIKEAVAFNNDETYEKAQLYLLLQTKIKSLTKEADELKTSLKSITEENGLVVPDSGSQYLEVHKKDAKTIILQNVCRTSVVPKANAAELVEEKLPALASRLTETILVLRDDRLEDMVKNGEISVEDAKSLLIEKTSYAFTPKYAKD